MLQLRPEQFDALNLAAKNTLTQRICNYLERELPEWTTEYSKKELSLFVEECVEVCELISIESDQGIAKYCCIALDAEVVWGLQETTFSYLTSSESPEAMLDRLIDTILTL